MRGSQIVLAGLGAAGLFAGTGLSAHATSDPALVMGRTGTIIARVTVSVPVTVTCAPGDVVAGPEGFTVEQASGGATTAAEGSIEGTVVCDGNAHSYSAVGTVLAGAPPLHGGRAVASLVLTVGTCGYTNPDGSCAWVGNLHSASTGQVLIHLT